MTKIPRKGMSRDDVFDELLRMESKDLRFSSGRVLGSMYTMPHPIAVEAHMRFIEANLGNPGLYRGTKEAEEKLVSMCADLLGGSAKNTLGFATSGGTESNLTALWMARRVFGKGKVLCGEHAHFSVKKACDMLGLELVRCPLDENMRVTAESIEERIDENTVSVIALAGSTEFGTVDDVEGIAQVVGEHTLFHVDAAFGGFVLPFMRELELAVPKFGLEIPRVDSLSVDPHKMGLSTIPCGVFLYREHIGGAMPEFYAPYLTSSKHRAVLGTRASGAVVGAYAVMLHLGVEGYTRIVKKCLENTEYLVRCAEDIGVYPVIEPTINIVVLDVGDAKAVQKRLRDMGWYVALTSKKEAIRIVVMPHVTRSVIDNFINDLRKCL
ncbi:MAG: tyrosine decarboxylase MfnA [Thermoplasmata archaeon]|nr:MAG: tyrosine decarboxylase MfnA [Thermoplasmata archaeon]